jgi:hypothetical protein
MEKSGLERMLEGSTCILSDGALYVLDEDMREDDPFAFAKVFGCSWPAFPAGNTLFYDRQFLLDNIAQAKEEAEKVLRQNSAKRQDDSRLAQLFEKNPIAKLAFGEGGLFSAPKISGSLIYKDRKKEEVSHSSSVEQILSDIYLSGFFPKNYEMFSSQGKIFSLRRESGQEAAVELNGIKYNSEGAFSEGRISEICWRSLAERLSAESKPADAPSLDVSQVEKFISDMNSKGVFERNYFGITKINGGIYAYKWINSRKEYALQNFWDRQGYLFSTAKVACEIIFQGSTLLPPKDETFVIEEYNHPFLHYNKEMESICIFKDGFSEEMRRCSAVPQKYERALAFGEKTLLSGYTNDSEMKPWHVLNVANFAGEYSRYKNLLAEKKPLFSNVETK